MNNTPTYVLKLFITGASRHSMLAVANVKNICDRHLPGRYQLEIVDVYQQPSLAQANDLIATPTLLKLEPAPVRRFIGDMSDSRALLNGLEISGHPI